MIVGTAGHIDHGKTALVHALTGVDTDRLAEEKQRGISIELGYAFLDAPLASDRIAFIDVPGHERLVTTMLMGATGIDYMLLLVAADDGVMPQTREHLAVLVLLGITDGAVVITKSDRADPAPALAEARELVAGTPLANAPILAVSSVTGQGINALKELLFAAAARPRARTRQVNLFRLAIDRVFTLGGVGTVIAGTVHAGSVSIGDELRLVPGDQRVRVRSVHAQNRPIDHADAGQRCAVAVTGVGRDGVTRGQWLVATEAALETRRLDASLSIWRAEQRPLRSGTRVHIHIGAASTTGSIAVLDSDSIEPDRTARVQLILDAAVGAWIGDRVVLRDASATRTIAGGTVLDPFAPARYRRTGQRLIELDALSTLDAAELIRVTPLGVDLARLRTSLGRAVDNTSLPTGTLFGGSWAIDASYAATICETALTALAAVHVREPDDSGPDVARLRRLAAPRVAEPLWLSLVSEWQANGWLARRGARVHLPEHGVRLSTQESCIAKKVAPALVNAGVNGTWVRDLSIYAQVPEAQMRTTLARLSRRGDVHQVVKDLYLGSSEIMRLAADARRLATEHGHVTPAAFRDATGLGRKRAVQVLEYFDHLGLLRRVGDGHRLRLQTQLFSDGE